VLSLCLYGPTVTQRKKRKENQRTHKNKIDNLRIINPTLH
jgi:hypothetical protein